MSYSYIKNPIKVGFTTNVVKTGPIKLIPEKKKDRMTLKKKNGKNGLFGNFF